MAVSALFLKQVDCKEEIATEIGMLTVEDGSNLYSNANMIFVLADQTDGYCPFTRRFKPTLIDFPVNVCGVIALARVTKIGGVERESLDDLGKVFENPDNAVAVATGIDTSQLFWVNGVGELYLSIYHLDTQMVVSAAGNVVFVNVDDGRENDVLLLNVAKFLLNVVGNSSEMFVFSHNL